MDVNPHRRYLWKHLSSLWIFQGLQFPPVESPGSGVLGDVNGDATANVADIILIVNMILEVMEPNYFTADLNNNNVINVADIILLVNIILDN